MANDMILLAESRQVEGESDLYAMAGDFGTASRLMREANELRARVFGKADPNQLREMTIVALANPLPLTAQREGELRNLTANTVIDREKDQITSDVLAGSRLAANALQSGAKGEE